MTPQGPRRARRAAGAHSSGEAPAAGNPVRWTREQTAELLLEPGTTDDKYRRGVLGLRTGSAAYPGAAVLSAEAAWRTGIGMVRYTPPLADSRKALGLPSPAAAVLAARPETVFMTDPGSAQPATDAWVIGSGTDPAKRSEKEHAALLALLAGVAPVVLDAGALDLVAADGTVAAFTAPRILTPHRGEFVALWRAAGLGDRPVGWPERGRSGRARVPAQRALISATTQLAERVSATVLLKGSTTITATPAGLVFLSGPATPWLATAGTGDVLAGILGSLVAAHAEPVRSHPELLGALGAAASELHDAAARRASGGGPITALDVAQALPGAIAEILQTRRA